jgi:flavin-dependent dehydrogenase
MTRAVDVAVIGGGPAGCAAAITLARAGRSVLLLERRTLPAFTAGEGLPPAATPLLRELGVMDRFRVDGHLPSYGNDSAWGDRTLRATEFIFDPNGHGWHLDRARFDATLRATAEEAGAVLLASSAPISHTRTLSGAWRLSCGREKERRSLEARWLLDCTGRRSWLARRLGAARVRHDRLLGFVTLFRPPAVASEADRDSRTLIEAAPEGWWYTALLPGRSRVVVYLTDGDTRSGGKARTSQGFAALLGETEHVRARLEPHAYALEAGPFALPASSERLDRFAGDGWTAAGDAAMAFDPLSSQGILAALSSGLRAGRAVHARLSGRPEALHRYERKLDQIYTSYLTQRTLFYGYERRWDGSEFWQRRHAAL